MLPSVVDCCNVWDWLGAEYPQTSEYADKFPQFLCDGCFRTSLVGLVDEYNYSARRKVEEVGL